MKKRLFLSLFGLAVSVLGSVAFAEDAFPITVTDALGQEVTVEAEPQAIVSLSPSSTEILYAVGAGEKVVGRTDYCNYPAEAAQVESVGSYMEPNMELILAKSPDLVIASDYIDDAIRAQLEEAGAAVCIVSANDLAAIERDILLVGELTGNKDKAEELTAGMEADAKALSEMIPEEAKGKKAFVDLGYFYSAGKGSLLDNVLSGIGLENIAAEEESLWPMLSVETIIEKNPDLYISLYSPLDELKATAGLEALECFGAENGFLFIDGMSEVGDMLQRPGPRYVEGMKALAEMVYPEVFAAEETETEADEAA